MSVLFETTAGNFVVDVENGSAGYNFLQLCRANYYFFAPFYGLDKDLIVRSGDPEYPETYGKAVSALRSVPEHFGSDKDGFLHLKNEKVIGEPQEPQSKSALGAVFLVAQESSTLLLPVVGSTFAIALTADWRTLQSWKNLVRLGTVAEGFTTLEKINNSETDSSGRPLTDIRITHTHILDDPFAEYPIERRPSEFTEAQLRSVRTERTAEKHDSSSSAAIALELLGDLPHYNIKPSPTTMFVAKVNPVTDAAAIASLFQRFGTVRGVTLVAGKSYGFVELSSVEEADAAYAGLQNCMVDGQKIVVDYSQSTR